jgi:hypothetical protein
MKKALTFLLLTMFATVGCEKTIREARNTNRNDDRAKIVVASTETRP